MSRCKDFSMRHLAGAAALLSMVVLSPAAYGQKAWLDLRPLGGPTANGGHTVFGWCGDVDGGTSCSSTADCVGDANGEQCYQTIELDSDDQEVYFEAWISNWAAFPNRTCWTPINGPLDTGDPCTTQTDCSGPEICGGSILTYTVGLDCSGYDNGTGVLEVPFTGSSCGDGFILLPPDGFCADVDRNDADWIHANAVSTIAALNAQQFCPQGEQPAPWFPGGGVVLSGLANDGTTNFEAYLATYAVKVPAGAKGTWTLFIEDDQDDPENVLVKHNAFLADSFFVDINTPLKIVLPVGRCCDHPGDPSGCLDGITASECTAVGGEFAVGESCSGIDDDADGVDNACDNCLLPNPNQADCQPNGVGDVCDLADGSSQDCNENGIPDECDPDADGDGIPDDCDNCVLPNPDQADCQPNAIGDACDIDDGTSQDCNGNGIPDECDPDADGDGIPDGCDNCLLPNPDQADCQPNGVGDVCDIAGGAVDDFPPPNGDGIPDACQITDRGRCCDHPGGALRCVDDITAAECFGTGSVLFAPKAVCSGVDSDGDGVDDVCDNCDLSNPDQADCDIDGVGDRCNIADCLGDLLCSDCDGRGTLDQCDIRDCPADNPDCQDCNGNGIPDECDIGDCPPDNPDCQDCNGNGIPDLCDIRDCPADDLTCRDCDGDRVPDGCNIMADPSLDCPSGVPNGILDACEEDCQVPDEAGNGSADTCDLTDGTSVDTNGNGIPDECEPGACCYFHVPSGTFNCDILTDRDCDIIRAGTFMGVDTECPTDTIGPVTHDGVVVVHITETAQGCDFGGGRGDACIPGDPIDAWETAPDVIMGHTFGIEGSPAIPPGFFRQGPDSDEFAGTVFLRGEPLGLADFGNADTLVQRTGGLRGTGDPFDRCELPSAAEVQVSVEVVELNLISTGPITVTFNGGQNPEQWDVAVDRSVVVPPLGTITAIKTHCNGGTYTSALNVQPRFTFTKVGDPSQVRVLDTGLAGIPFVTLIQDAASPSPWTADVSDTLPLVSNICTSFHPGVEDPFPTTDCDCNGNLQRDVCDMETGVDPDCNGNAIPDSCDIAANPSLDCQPDGILDSCQLNTDGDAQIDDCDDDDDNDGVSDAADADRLNPNICEDADGDGCDDCAVGRDGFGPLSDNDPSNDGPDTDSDGLCDTGDACTDVDGDGWGQDTGNGINCPKGSVPDCDDTGFNGIDTDVDNVCAPNDNCHLFNPDQADCQPNGVGDVCDIASGTSPDGNGNGVPDECDLQPPFPENTLGVTDCMNDAACAKQAYCVPDPVGGFPGTCYVPKNRYLSVAPNPTNDVPTARRLSVVTFERSCGGAGNMPCISNTECAGNSDGTTCDDVRVGSQVIGWFGQPDVDGYVGVVDEAIRHYAIWADLSVPIECGVDELCPSGSHCDTGLGASNTCRLDADNTEVLTALVQLSGCHISPKKRDTRPGMGENEAANYYLVETILQGSDITNPSSYSLPLELRTVVVWGDMTGGTQDNVALPPDNTPGFLDILHQVNRFKDKGKATTAWLDLNPQVPDRRVGFLDMLEGVNGFKDQPYPFVDPCACAGLAPCN